MCPEQWEFAAEGFSKGKRDSMKMILRRKPLTSSQSMYHTKDDAEEHLQPDSSRCQIPEHMDLGKKVERLQKEKEELLDKWIKLQHEQQVTERSLMDLEGRLQAMEEHQQQVVAFFAQVLSPSFWLKFTQKPPESNLLSAFNKEKLIACEDVEVDTVDQQRASSGPEGCGGDTIIPCMSADSQEESFSEQLNLYPPSCRPLIYNSVRHSMDHAQKQAHNLIDCMKNGEHLDVAVQQEKFSTESTCPHEFLPTGDSRVNDANYVGHAIMNKQLQENPGSNTNIELAVGDGVGQGSPLSHSLHDFSNQSLKASQLSLSCVTSKGEVPPPSECLTTAISEVYQVQTSKRSNHSRHKRKSNVGCYGFASKITTYSCKRKYIDKTCYGPSNETTPSSRCMQNLGNNPVTHVCASARTGVCSASQSSGERVRKGIADGSGSNDGFWEKYLTESPTSSDTEASSESDDVIEPCERQYL
ncbi:hypothetical protein KP509_13G060800 [Ceratopteris richardii]|nr:hypothetical protein KP509_13G060800 [Ceratopteris richardii]